MNIRSRLNALGKFYRKPHECDCGSEELSDNIVDHKNETIYRACYKCKDMKRAKYLWSQLWQGKYNDNESD